MFNLHITGLGGIDIAPRECQKRVTRGIQKLIEKLMSLHVTEITIVLNEVWGSKLSFEGKAQFNRVKKLVDKAIKDFQTIQFSIVPGGMISSAEIQRLYPSDNNYLILNYAGSEINDNDLLNNLHFIETTFSSFDVEHEYIVSLFEHIKEDFTLDYFFHQTCIQTESRRNRIPLEARVEVHACIPLNRQHYQILDRHPSSLTLNPPCQEPCGYTTNALIIHPVKDELLNSYDDVSYITDIDNIYEIYRNNGGGFFSRLRIFFFSSPEKIIENMTQHAEKNPNGASAKTLSQIF